MKAKLLKIKNQVNILLQLIGEERSCLEGSDYEKLDKIISEKNKAISSLDKLKNNLDLNNLDQEFDVLVSEISEILSESARINRVNSVLVSGLMRMNKKSISILTGREEDSLYGKSGSTGKTTKTTIGVA